MNVQFKTIYVVFSTYPSQGSPVFIQDVIPADPRRLSEQRSHFVKVLLNWIIVPNYIIKNLCQTSGCVLHDGCLRPEECGVRKRERERWVVGKLNEDPIIPWVSLPVWGTLIISQTLSLYTDKVRIEMLSRISCQWIWLGKWTLLSVYQTAIEKSTSIQKQEWWGCMDCCRQTVSIKKVLVSPDSEDEEPLTRKLFVDKCVNRVLK